MKKILILFFLCCFYNFLSAQFVYKIKADSVKITNDSCNAELIIENSTKNTKGFLYNYGNGRTRFQKGLINSGDSIYIIGNDTLKLSSLNNDSLFGLKDNIATQARNFNLNGYKFKFQGNGSDTIGMHNLRQMVITKGGDTYLNTDATLIAALSSTGATLSVQRSQSINAQNRIDMINNKGADFNSLGPVPAGFVANEIGFLSYAGNSSTLRRSAKIWHVITGLGNTGVQAEVNIRVTDTTNTEFIPFVARHNGIFLNVNGPDGTGTLIGGTLRDLSAKLEIQSTTQGFLGPRMTSSQRIAISSPAIGLLVYDTDSSALLLYNGGWHKLAMSHQLSASGGGSYWGLSGNSGTNSGINFVGTLDNISLRIRTNNSERAVVDSTGKVGIATSSPEFKLDVNGDARIATLPFIASRDTLLTHDPVTKQISASFAKGTLLNIQVLTSGSTYTPTTGTKSVVIHLVGGGGGGGGVTSAGNNNANCGAGGGGGSHVIKYVSSLPSGTFSYSIGSAGSAGSSSGGNGGNGGNTTITVSGTTYTAPGGSGGNGSSSGASSALIMLAGSGGSVGTNGDVNGSGQPGQNGMRLSGTVATGGAGASTNFGGGGNARITSGTGNSATGYGGAGAGAATFGNGGGAQTGGAGTAGIIVIYEYR